MEDMIVSAKKSDSNDLSGNGKERYATRKSEEESVTIMFIKVVTD